MTFPQFNILLSFFFQVPQVYGRYRKGYRRVRQVSWKQKYNFHRAKKE